MLSLGCVIWIIAALATLFWPMLLKIRLSNEKHGVLHNLFYFGKLRNPNFAVKSFVINVPKRWFLHFYSVGVICNTTVLFLFINKSYFGVPWPQIFQSFLDILYLPNISTTRTEHNDISIALVLIMEELQVIRRLYECLYIHSFSNCSIGIVAYVVGILFYGIFGTSLLSEIYPSNISISESMLEILWMIISIILFFWSWINQHKTFQILASLRTNKRESNGSMGHFLPNSGLFKYVSCPHYFTEILIFLSMNMVMKFRHINLLCYLIFVGANQVMFGLITHAWYINAFPAYPKNRYAIIPYVL